MRNKTELSTAILTSPMAQQIIDYVSPIYGNSYVGLWLFQAIGVALDEVCFIAEKLRTETNPATADLLLDYWEDHYGLMRDDSLTTKRRQTRLAAHLQSRGPCNPERLAAAVSSALGGATVQIRENFAQNTFRVEVLETVTDIEPARAILDKKKPAHLLYEIQVIGPAYLESEVKTAVAYTEAESYTLEVQQE